MSYAMCAVIIADSGNPVERVPQSGAWFLLGNKSLT